MEAFDKFIKTLPDRGQGSRIVFPNLRDQAYVGLMTRAQAVEINKNPIVDQLSEATALYEVDDAGSDFYGRYNDGSITTSGHHNKISHRASDYDVKVEFFPDRHLQLISYPKDQNFIDQSWVATTKYARDSSEGEGTFVYVIDSGIDLSHVVSHFQIPSAPSPFGVAPCNP